MVSCTRRKTSARCRLMDSLDAHLDAYLDAHVNVHALLQVRGRRRPDRRRRDLALGLRPQPRQQEVHHHRASGHTRPIVHAYPAQRVHIPGPIVPTLSGPACPHTLPPTHDSRPRQLTARALRLVTPSRSSAAAALARLRVLAVQMWFRRGVSEADPEVSLSPSPCLSLTLTHTQGKGVPLQGRPWVLAPVSSHM